VGAAAGDVVMGGTGKGGHVLPQSVSPNARAVYDIIKAHSPSIEGMHVNNINSMSELSADAVTRAVRELQDGGFIFSTMDEWHMAILDF